MTTSRKTTLVTGASQGIGAAAAIAFAQSGYNVVINYRRDKAGAETTAATCQKSDVNVTVIQGDMRSESDVDQLASTVIKEFGVLDVLVNNAAETKEPNFDKLSKQEALESVESNFITAVLAIRAFTPNYMSKGSVVLNVASIYGTNQNGNPMFAMYSASKAALINLTQTLALKYSPDIRFNAVSPGFTLTPHWDTVTGERKKSVLETSLLKEFVQAEEIAQTLLFIAKTKHINAENIVVDSGWSKRQNR